MTIREWIKEGDVLFNLRRYEEALNAYEKAIELDSHNVYAWHKKALTLFNLGRYEEALNAYEKAIELDQCNADVWYGKGVALCSLKKYKEALKIFERIMELNPQYLLALNGKGVALCSLKKYQEALEIFEKATKLNPQYLPAWNGKGVALYYLGKYQEALEIFEKATKLNPQYPSVWYNKGITSKNIERYEEALKAFDRFIELDPKYLDAWCNKDAVLLSLGRYEEALKILEDAIKLDEDNVNLWNNKALILFNLGRPKEASEALRIAIDKNQKKGEEDDLLHANFAELFYFLEDLESASIEVNKALDINSMNTRALILKGRIKTEKKDYNSATKCFEEAICSDLGNPIPLLWNIYIRYLSLEFNSTLRNFDVKNKKYKEGIGIIIRKLEKMNRLYRNSEKGELKAWILYFLGYFYYKNTDMFTARERLEECIKSSSSEEESKRYIKSKSRADEKAKKLLECIWVHKMRPTLLQWWLSSPLNRWKKRIIFFLILSLVFLLLILHPLISTFFPVNPYIYIMTVIVMLFFIFLPVIQRIVAEGVEVELCSPPSFELFLSPIRMEPIIDELAIEECFP